MRSGFMSAYLAVTPFIIFAMFQGDEGASVPEANVVIQMTVEDFITLIHNYVQVCCGC